MSLIRKIDNKTLFNESADGSYADNDLRKDSNVDKKGEGEERTIINNY